MLQLFVALGDNKDLGVTLWAVNNRTQIALPLCTRLLLGLGE